MSASVAVQPVSSRVRRLSQSLDSLSFDSWVRGLRAASHQTARSRFTLSKARRLIRYSTTTSVWRQLAIVVLFPLPGLVASLLTPLISLRDPALGPVANVGFYPHAFLTAGFTLLGATIQAREVTGISHDEVSSLEIAIIAFIATTHLIAMIAVPCFIWRFPVPFSWVLSYAPWMACFIWGHIVVLRGRVLRPGHIRSRLLLFMPLLSLQVSQIVLYPAYSAVFEAAGAYEQLLLIALFPFLKYALKRSIFLVSHHFRDFSLEEGVCSVEISASMYQSMIMQTTPSPLTIALVIAIDLIIGVIDVKRFMDRVFVIPRPEIMVTAFKILQDEGRALQEEELNVYASKRATIVPETMKKSVKRMGAVIKPSRSGVGGNGIVHIAAMVTPTPAPRAQAIVSGLKKDRQIVTQALEVLQSAECILLVEYLEVIVPIVNTLYLAVASQLQSAIYNPKIREFYHNKEALRAAIVTIALYAVLQATTFAIMCVVMRARFRLSALTLLAFLIESRSWSLQGKMLAWVPFTFAFSIMHYGVDFTFKFDFTVPPHS